MTTENKLSCFIVGFTGGTGRELVKACAKSEKFERIVCMGRRITELDPEIAGRCEQKIVDFENLEASKELFEGLHVGFCCLGTLRRQVGREMFIKVDRDYIMAVAEMAFNCGITQFHLVSSIGANKDSSFLYTRIKGEVEHRVTNLGFKNLFIYRPALLIREPPRPFETCMFCCVWPIYKCAPASVITRTWLLAKAMANCANVYDKPCQHMMTNHMIYDAEQGNIPE